MLAIFMLFQFSLKRTFRFLVKIFSDLILFLLFIILLFYFPTVVYDFPKEKPFSGSKIFNPYENISSTYFKSNFHAHSQAWKGITNGKNSEKDIFEGYTSKGYDIAGISNYHSISTYAKNITELYVPLYEHGYNIFKNHYLVFNSNDVSYFDFPLLQTTSHQQKIINNLKKSNGLVAIAHPKFGGGRSFTNMRTLVNYDFTEVLNHYRVSDQYWDEALSAGRLSWIIGNDDIHDLKDDIIYRMWTVIFSCAGNKDTILNNLKLGMNYAERSFNGISDNKFLNCTQSNAFTYTFNFENTVDSIYCIGQNGQILKKESNKNKFEYKFLPDDTYMRVVAKNNNSVIYLNPLVRYDGQKIPLCTNLIAGENFLLTWTFRFFIIFSFLIIIFLKRKILSH